MQYVTGVDLGGTNIVVGTLAIDGSEFVGHVTRPTEADRGADAVIHRMLEMIAESRQASPGEVVGIGVGAPGPIHRETGIVRIAPNLRWRDVPLAPRLAEVTGLPVTLNNDASCAVLGEWWHGAGRGSRHLIGLTVGTGIGGGIVINGELWHGASDLAGEFGHMTIDSTGRRCSCGNYGCLEAYASGPNIAQRAVESLEAGAESRIPSYVDGNLSRLTAEVVYEAAGDGDEVAREVVRETARFLGIGVANLVNIFNPDIVLVMGGVTRAGDRLFQPLKTEVQRRAFRAASEVCRILPGELPGTAGVYGAVRTFLDQQR